MKNIVIAGTDTEIGKTVFCAALMLGLQNAKKSPYYWKPIQSGVDCGVDTKTVRGITGLNKSQFLPEGYVFSSSLSPHKSAELDGKKIDFQKLANILSIPKTEGHLVIEGAGGLMVPLTYENLQIDLYKKWNIPLILCARSGLGTINHTLLSLEALKNRRITVAGVAFIGDINPDNIEAVKSFSDVKILGTLPVIDNMNADSLLSAFNDNFNIQDFL